MTIPSPARMRIAWGLASLFYAYQYILRVMPNIMMQDIVDQFSIDATIFGQFSGMYYIGYALMHLPLGIALDKYGPKKIVPACILMTAAGLLPLIYSSNWVVAIAGRALIGVGSSAAILGLFKIIRMTFTEQQFTHMLSLSVTVGLMGAIYGGGPIQYFCSLIGYHAVLIACTVAALILALIMYSLLPDYSTPSKVRGLSSVSLVLQSPLVLWICLCAGFMVGPLEGFADVWGTAFLKQVYGLSDIVAATMPSALFIGMCFGGPFLSLIAERTGHYLGTIIAAGMVMALGFILLLATTIPTALLPVLFLIVGACCAYQILAIYKASTYVPAYAVGITSALANMIIMLFGYLFHASIGFIITSMGGTANSTAFLSGIATIPAGLLIGVCGLFLIRKHE